jgi:hypothetical protein
MGSIWTDRNPGCGLKRHRSGWGSQVPPPSKPHKASHLLQHPNACPHLGSFPQGSPSTASHPVLWAVGGLGKLFLGSQRWQWWRPAILSSSSLLHQTLSWQNRNSKKAIVKPVKKHQQCKHVTKRKTALSLPCECLCFKLLASSMLAFPLYNLVDSIFLSYFHPLCLILSCLSIFMT